MRKPAHTERVPAGKKELLLQRRQPWFGKSVIEIFDGKTSVTRLGYSLKEKKGQLGGMVLHNHVNIPPEYRNQKLLSRMVDHALGDLKSRGAKEIRVDLAPDRESVEKVESMFSRRGFKPEREFFVQSSNTENPFLVPGIQGKITTWVWREGQ